MIDEKDVLRPELEMYEVAIRLRRAEQKTKRVAAKFHQVTHDGFAFRTRWMNR